MSPLNALITGITGFIGSNLARALVNRNWKVVGSHRSKNRIHRLGNAINKIKLFKDESVGVETIISEVSNQKFDVIFHLAAQTSHTFSLKNPLTDLQTNLASIVKILEFLKKQKNPPYLILASSKGVVGKPKSLPVNENTPCYPEDPYSIHKHALEHYARVYAEKYNVNNSVFRLTNVYGPRQQIISPQKGFINFFVGQGLQGRPLKIFGDGKQKRDISYIDDIVNVLILAAEQKHEGNNLFFLGTNSATAVRDIALEIASLTDSEAKFEPYPPEFKSIEVGDFLVDYSKANQLLNWRPVVGWKTGLKKTINFYRENLQEYLAES